MGRRLWKVTVYLKGGQTVEFKCDSVSFSYNRNTGEYTGYNIVNSLPAVDFAPTQIAAWSRI